MDVHEHTLALACPICKTPPGQVCWPNTKYKKFHAERIDKGHAALRKERTRIFDELGSLL